MSTATLLLHPVRLRITQAFLGRGELTVAQLREHLPGIAPATLYRHVATLAEAGILVISHERPVRGTTERTYRLEASKASVTEEDAARMTADDHRVAFTAFIAAILDDADRYFDQEPAPDLAADAAGYRQAAIHATDDEMRQIADELRAVLQPWIDAPPAPGRRRRTLTTITLPGETDHL